MKPGEAMARHVTVTALVLCIVTQLSMVEARPPLSDAHSHTFRNSGSGELVRIGGGIAEGHQRAPQWDRSVFSRPTFFNRTASHLGDMGATLGPLIAAGLQRLRHFISESDASSPSSAASSRRLLQDAKTCEAALRTLSRSDYNHPLCRHFAFGSKLAPSHCPAPISSAALPLGSCCDQDGQCLSGACDLVYRVCSQTCTYDSLCICVGCMCQQPPDFWYVSQACPYGDVLSVD